MATTFEVLAEPRRRQILDLLRGGERLVGDLVVHLARAQADGTVDAETDPDDAARVMFGFIPGFVLQRLLLGTSRPPPARPAWRPFSPAPDEPSRTRNGQR
jgi:hypothetical protein